MCVCVKERERERESEKSQYLHSEQANTNLVKNLSQFAILKIATYKLDKKYQYFDPPTKLFLPELNFELKIVGNQKKFRFNLKWFISM